MCEKLDFLKYTMATPDLMPRVTGSLALPSILACKTGRFVALLSLCLLGVGAALNADEPARLTISESFEKEIQPLLVSYCGKCHGNQPKDNDLDLTISPGTQAVLTTSAQLVNTIPEPVGWHGSFTRPS